MDNGVQGVDFWSREDDVVAFVTRGSDRQLTQAYKSYLEALEVDEANKREKRKKKSLRAKT